MLIGKLLSIFPYSFLGVDMAISVQQLKEYIEKMQGMYDVVRIVEPGSCHVVDAAHNKDKSQSDLCYTFWNKCERC